LYIGVASSQNGKKFKTALKKRAVEIKNLKIAAELSIFPAPASAMLPSMCHAGTAINAIAKRKIERQCRRDSQWQILYGQLHGDQGKSGVTDTR